MIQLLSIHRITKVPIVASDFRLRELPDFTDLDLATDFLYPMVELLQFLVELLLLGFDFKPGLTPDAFFPVEGKSEKIELCSLGVVEIDNSCFLLIELSPVMGHTLVQLLNMKPHISLTDHARKYLGMSCFEDKEDKENN